MNLAGLKIAFRKHSFVRSGKMNWSGRWPGYWSKIKTWFAPQVLTPCLGFWSALTVIGVAALISSRSARSREIDRGAVTSPMGAAYWLVQDYRSRPLEGIGNSVS